MEMKVMESFVEASSSSITGGTSSCCPKFLTLSVATKTLHSFVSATGPFLAIFLGIIQVLIARDTESTTLFETFGQWNDNLVKKIQFLLIPHISWIRFHTASSPRFVDFLKKSLIPFFIDVLRYDGNTAEHVDVGYIM